MKSSNHDYKCNCEVLFYNRRSVIEIRQYNTTAVHDGTTRRQYGGSTVAVQWQYSGSADQDGSSLPNLTPTIP